MFLTGHKVDYKQMDQTLSAVCEISMPGAIQQKPPTSEAICKSMDTVKTILGVRVST